MKEIAVCSMPQKTIRVGVHLIFWIITSSMSIFLLGYKTRQFSEAAMLTSLFMPLTAGTAYFVSYRLIPQYYFTKQYGKLALYSFYTLIAALQAVLLLDVFALMYLAGYQFSQLLPVCTGMGESTGFCLSGKSSLCRSAGNYFKKNLIESYVHRVPWLTSAGTCKNVWEADQILKDQKVDLLLLDIEMPEISGLNFVKNWAVLPEVIFITAHREFAVEAFDLQVSDYVLKPVGFERFLKAVNRFAERRKSLVAHHTSTLQKECLFVRAERVIRKISFENILYLESKGDYVKIYLTEEKPVLTKTSLKDIFGRLASSSFLQIHRSYIIHLRYLQAYANDKVQVSNTWLPVSNNHKPELLHYLEE